MRPTQILPGQRVKVVIDFAEDDHLVNISWLKPCISLKESLSLWNVLL